MIERIDVVVRIRNADRAQQPAVAGRAAEDSGIFLSLRAAQSVNYGRFDLPKSGNPTPGAGSRGSR